MGFLNTILDIIFPVKCISCKKNGAYLCAACLSDAPHAERESAKWIFPIYDYRHPSIKKSLWLLKYKGRKRLVNVFAEILYDKIIEELSELRVMENFRNPVIIPIPLSPKRYRERGFNQAELICRELIKINNLRLSMPSLRWQEAGHGVNMYLGKNILIKPKDTLHQATIQDRSTRLKNLSGSFYIKNQKPIEGKNIILIDDITTTGATLAEARKILKQNGARKVIAFTIAH